MSLFTELHSQIETIIANMPSAKEDYDFTTHEFILRFAQQHQYAYIDALYEHKMANHISPFRELHKAINQLLKEQFSDFLIEVAKNQPSTDIFGNASTCSHFKKK